MNVPDLYYMQDAHIDFAAFGPNGPMDLSSGKVIVSLEREGLKPFALQIDTDDPSLTQWKDKTQGTGVITVPLSSFPLCPLGHMRLQIVAVDGTGKEEFQYLSWVIINKTVPIV